MSDNKQFGNSEQLNDTISRQAAIDALEKVAELFPWKVPGNRNSYDRYNEAWNDAIGRAEIEIEKLPSAQRWIPVTPKTLPKKVGDYLVTTHSGQIARYIYMGNGSSKDYWMRCVLAWMPLPEPYKGEPRC